MTPFGPFGSDSSPRTRGVIRADLHVHSRHSASTHAWRPGGKAGGGEPIDIYRAAKERGMGLVTLTDVDTIEGCLRLLDRLPSAGDIVISEEITTGDPRTGRRYHVLAWGVTESQHRAFAGLRQDVRALAGYLRSEGIVAALGTGPGDSGAEIWSDPEAGSILDLFDRVEVKSGAHGRHHNEVAARLASARGVRLGFTGGSCAHGPARVGRTWTAANASGPVEFMQELRACRTWPAGADGRLWELPLRHGWRHARQAVRARRAGRHLDLKDLETFQQKARTYAPGSAIPGRRATGLP